MKKTPYSLFKMRKRKLQLDSVPGLKGQYRYLRREEFFADFAAIRHEFFVPSGAEPDTELNLAKLAPEEVRELLIQLGLQTDIEAHVIWCSDEDGAVLPFGRFAAAYDDLWQPLLDDIWVTPANHAWLLELDHEEVLRFWRR